MRSVCSVFLLIASFSERELRGQLQLARVAHSLAQEAVEVEQRHRGQWVDQVLVVEGVEHLDGRDDRVTFGEAEDPRQSPVEREKFVVLAQRVAVGGRANARSTRSNLCLARGAGLRAAGLDTRVGFKAPGQIAVQDESEFVVDVAIRTSIIGLQIVEAERAISERVAFVRIVVAVSGQRIVPIELEPSAEPFAHSNYEAAIE